MNLLGQYHVHELMSVCQLLCYLLTPCLLLHSDMKTSEKMGQDHNDPEPAFRGDIQMEYSSD